jgi:DNA repair ATPase RecN
MISVLSLQNYESHLNTTLEFGSGVNVVVGSTERGKSSIIRSIKWVVDNRPGGEEFRSHWSLDKDTVVTIKKDDTTVIRTRGKDKNTYWCDGIDYRAFGQDVPTPIKEKLNLTSLNIQYQFDTPFLLSESPGEVARYLNQIINLDDIDESLKNVNGLLKQVDSDTKHTTKRLEEINNDLQTYPDFDKIDQQLKILDQCQQIIDSNEYTIELLEQLLYNIVDTHNNAIFVPTIDIDYWQELLRNYESINKTIDELRNLERNIFGCDTASITIPDYNKDLDKWLNQQRQLSNRVFELDKLIKEIKLIEPGIIKLEMEIRHWEKIYQQRFPQVCPLCLQPILKDCVAVGVVKSGRRGKSG